MGSCLQVLRGDLWMRPLCGLVVTATYEGSTYRSIFLTLRTGVYRHGSVFPILPLTPTLRTAPTGCLPTQKTWHPVLRA